MNKEMRKTSRRKLKTITNNFTVQKAFLENIISAQLVDKFPASMEHKHIHKKGNAMVNINFSASQSYEYACRSGYSLIYLISAWDAG
jgi:hypothetical protein